MPPIDPYTSAERRQPSPGWAAVRGFARLVRRAPVTVLLAVVAASLLTGAATQATAGNTVVLAAAGLLIGCAAGMLHRPAPDRRLLAARPGLAQTQLLILGAVIAVLIILGGSGFAIYRSTVSGAEDGAAKETVDRLIGETENYWQQYALSRDGTREITYSEWCDFLNQQFTTETDLTLRAAITAVTNRAEGGVLNATQTGDAATCGTTDALAAAGTGAAAGQAMATWQADGLGNSRSAVLIDTQTRSAGTPAAATDMWQRSARVNLVPAGTNTTATELEVVSIATISSTGNTFCAVYVLDSDDPAETGVYRFAQTPGDTGPLIPEACVGGSPAIAAGTDVGEPWPAAS